MREEVGACDRSITFARPVSAAGETAAAGPDRRVEAVGQRPQDVEDSGAAGRAEDLGVRRLAAALRDRLAQRRVGLHRVLQQQADVLGQRVQVDVAQVGAVEAHGPGLRVGEAHEQPRRRRLAHSAGPDQRDDLARIGGEADVEQGRVPRARVRVGDGPLKPSPRADSRKLSIRARVGPEAPRDLGGRHRRPAPRSSRHGQRERRRRSTYERPRRRQRRLRPVSGFESLLDPDLVAPAGGLSETHAGGLLVGYMMA